MTNLLLLLLAAQAAPPTLEVDLEGMRNHNGVIRACLTQQRRGFPDCSADPRAIRRSFPASDARLIFTGFTPGAYALTLFHDENANGKLDTLFGIPREGFGFSRNPVVRFGAPRYEKVSMELGPRYTHISVRLQYLL